jgi:hypothetical protein
VELCDLITLKIHGELSEEDRKRVYMLVLLQAEA